jgi:hypothetical protein
MSLKQKISAVIAAVIILFGGSYSATNIGSVGRTSEYKATTTVSMAAMQLIQTGESVLGSVIIASSSAITMRIWNATSTTDSASTTVAIFKAAAGENTYTFDTVLTRGLVIAPASGFNGAYTITYR